MYESNSEPPMSPRAQALLRRIEGSQSTASQWGGAIGTVGGGLLGGLVAGIPSGGSLALPGATLGASVGGGLGSTIGGMIGGNDAAAAEKEFEELRRKELEPMLQRQNAQAAVGGLLGPWLTVRGM